MISASHNPFYDNGIKLLNANGEKMEDAVIEKIEDYLDGKIGEIPYATRENIGCTVDHSAAVLFISSTLFKSSGAAKGPFLILLLIFY